MSTASENHRVCLSVSVCVYRKLNVQTGHRLYYDTREASTESLTINCQSTRHDNNGKKERIKQQQDTLNTNSVRGHVMPHVVTWSNDVLAHLMIQVNSAWPSLCAQY